MQLKGLKIFVLTHYLKSSQLLFLKQSTLWQDSYTSMGYVDIFGMHKMYAQVQFSNTMGGGWV